jgi:hypothetical protein
MHFKFLVIFALLILFACSDENNNPTWPFERSVLEISIAKRPSHYLLTWRHPIERRDLQSYYIWIDTTVVKDYHQNISLSQMSLASEIIPYNSAGDSDSLDLTSFISEFLERDSLHIAIWAVYSGKEQGAVQHKYIYFGDDIPPYPIVHFSDSSSSNVIWIDWMRPKDQRDFYSPEIIDGPIAGYNITVQAKNSSEDIRSAGLKISLDGKTISTENIKRFQRFRKKGREVVLENVANTEPKLLKFAVIDGKGFDAANPQANNWKMEISGLKPERDYRILIVAYDSAGNQSGSEEIENGTYRSTTDAIPPLIAKKFWLYQDPGDGLPRLDSNRLILFWPRSVDPLRESTGITIDSELHIPASCYSGSCYREVKGYLVEQWNGKDWKIISDIKNGYARHSLQNDSMIIKEDGNFVSDTLRWISPGDAIILRMRAVDSSGAYSEAWTSTITTSKGELWQYKCPPEFAPVKNNSDVFCMEKLQHISKDTFEINVLYRDAKKSCENLGYHLCTEEERNAACTSRGSLYGVIEENDFKVSNFLKEYCGVGTGDWESANKLEKRNKICASPDGIRDLPGQLQEWVVGKSDSGEVPLLKGSSYAIFEGVSRVDLAQCKNRFTPTRIRAKYTTDSVYLYRSGSRIDTLLTRDSLRTIYAILPPSSFKDTLLVYTLKSKNGDLLGFDYVDKKEYRKRGGDEWLKELWKGLKYEPKEERQVLILGTESINATNFFLDPTVGFRCCTVSK